MKVLVAPLNWGLGHASRCVPLVQRFLDEGHEVILGGDGDSLTLLRRHFPKLRYVYLAPLTLRYSKGSRQVFAMLRAIPKMISWSIKDHALLKTVLREEPFDLVISDNRFGLYIGKNTEYRVQNTDLKCVYMTHQLHIMLPKGWRWAEGIAERLHKRIYNRFDEVWVPDFEDKEKSLSGELGHPKSTEYRIQHTDIKYLGPLSRFTTNPLTTNPLTRYDIVAVLSGLEPHRTMLEKELVARYSGKKDQVLIVQGLMGRPKTTIKRGNITIVPYMSDVELAAALSGAKHIIARSGYSTIMDMHALGLLDKAEIIPTPGQPEQEYLAEKYKKKGK